MKILVAGIGNIFMGDDGFGCEVAARLSRCELPTGVDLVDFGIRSLDLSYALMDGYEVVILIDAVDRGEAPGTVYLIEPDIDNAEAAQRVPGEPLMTPHELDATSVLRFIATLEQRPRVLMVGCQPQFLGAEEGYMGLSDVVAGAVEKAMGEVLGLLSELSASALPRQQPLLA
ncbi:MAG: Hydrogenase maturation protease [Pseudomonas sp.]|nr:Hydrogenase maturation protease [Pseudomonas sp.]